MFSATLVQAFKLKTGFISQAEEVFTVYADIICMSDPKRGLSMQWWHTSYSSMLMLHFVSQSGQAILMYLFHFLYLTAVSYHSVVFGFIFKYLINSLFFTLLHNDLMWTANILICREEIFPNTVELHIIQKCVYNLGFVYSFQSNVFSTHLIFEKDAKQDHSSNDQG